MKRLAILAAVLLLGVGLSAPQTAQGQSLRIGPRVGIPVGDLSDNGNLFFGADARYVSPNLPVVPNASFDFYLTEVDNTSIITVDLNALYPFEGGTSFVPYVGGGLGITRSSVEFAGETRSDSEVGLNLIGGAQFDTGSLKPFAQANITVGGDATRVGIAGGLLFGF